MTARTLTGRSDQPASRSRRAATPDRRVARLVIETAASPGLWGVVGSVLLVSLGLTLVLARFDLTDEATWTGVASITRWIAGVAGLTVVSGIRQIVVHGITRRDALRGLAVGTVALCGVAATAITVGAAIEWGVFAGHGQVTTPAGSVASLGVVWAVSASTLLAYVLGGAAIGVAFGSLPWGPAIAAIVPSLVPPVLTGALWGAVVDAEVAGTGPFDGLLRGLVEPGVAGGLAAFAVPLVAVALAWPLLRRGVALLEFPAT